MNQAEFKVLALEAAEHIKYRLNTGDELTTVEMANIVIWHWHGAMLNDLILARSEISLEEELAFREWKNDNPPACWAGGHPEDAMSTKK